jgi:hypothetical protein
MKAAKLWSRLRASNKIGFLVLKKREFLFSTGQGFARKGRKKIAETSA